MTESKAIEAKMVEAKTLVSSSSGNSSKVMLEQLMERNFFDADQTGSQRLKALFRDIWKGETRAELQAVKVMAISSSFVGGVYGGVLRNTKLQEDFIRRHNHRVFLGLADAKRMYYDYLTLYALRSGVTYGAKCGLFGTLFGTQMMCILVYRDDLRVTDCALGLGLASSMTRISMGLRAIGASFVIGAVGGLIAGGLAKALLLVSGQSTHDLLVWANREYFYERMTRRQKILANAGTSEKDDFVSQKLAGRANHPF